MRAYGLDSFNQAVSPNVSTTIRTNGGGDCLPKVLVLTEESDEDDNLF